MTAPGDPLATLAQSLDAYVASQDAMVKAAEELRPAIPPVPEEQPPGPVGLI